MAKGWGRDGRETFLLGTQRFRDSAEVPKAPQKGAIEFYFRQGIPYYLDSSGVEHPFFGVGTAGGSGLEIQDNGATVNPSISILNFGSGLNIVDNGSGKVTASVDTETFQDLVGGMLSDSAEIDFTYNDPSNNFTADLKVTTVSPGSYGSASSIPSFTVDSKGRLTAAGSAALAATNVAYTPAGDLTATNVEDALDALAVDQFSWEYIPIAVAVTIPVNRQMIVSGSLTNDGTLTVDGSMTLI